MKKSHNRLVYIGVLVFSLLFLFVGNRIVTSNLDLGEYEDEFVVISAVVTDVFAATEGEPLFWNPDVIPTVIPFNARIISGEREGELLRRIYQEIPDPYTMSAREVAVGNRVMLVFDSHREVYAFNGFQRINPVLFLGIIFLLLMILFGKKKGFNSIIALGFICAAIFAVFIPAILAGRNIYVATFVIITYSIISTLLIVIGFNKKAISAMLGCLGGVIFAGVLMAIMGGIVQLTGVVDRESINLMFFNIDLRAIVFAGVIIGSAGAIMDVAMSISSSLWEVKEAGGKSDFRSLFKSGTEIGKDILGTMLNTLILAYIGSSLTVILLLTMSAGSFVELFNREMIVVEFLRAIVGSFGMFLTLPLTAAICAALYTRNVNDENEKQIENEAEKAGL